MKTPEKSIESKIKYPKTEGNFIPPEIPAAELRGQMQVTLESILRVQKRVARIEDAAARNRTLDELENRNNITRYFRMPNVIAYKIIDILMGLLKSKNWGSLIPEKAKVADSLLLFFCKPDDAEAATGDLLEKLDDVRCLVPDFDGLDLQ